MSTERSMPQMDTLTRIMREIWLNRSISRIKIAENLHIVKSAVTSQVNTLIEQGIAQETAEGETGKRGGRKPIYLSINKDYGYIFGIEIQTTYIIAVAVNLAGDILETITEDGLSVSKDNLVATIIAFYKRLKKQMKYHQGKLLGLGVGTGGLISPRDGTIFFSAPLSISEPLNIIQEITRCIDTPFFIENDANCCAWGELTFNRCPEPRNILFVLVEFKQALAAKKKYGGVGVGFGIVINGTVYYGSDFYAGEFRSVLCDRADDLQFSLSRDELSRIFTDKSILEKFSNELAKNIAMLANTMNFSRVFIGGDMESVEFDFCELLKRKINENWIYPINKQVMTQYSSLGAKSVAYGAAARLLDWLFSSNNFPLSDIKAITKSSGQAQK